MSAISDIEPAQELMFKFDEEGLNEPIRRDPGLIPPVGFKTRPHPEKLTTFQLFEMADRYPSLEEFGEGQTEVKDETGDIDVLGGDEDFLARERAALGDDADLFTGPGDNAMNQSQTNAAEEDLLGGDDDFSMVNAGSAESKQFESSFPAIDIKKNENVGPGGTITGSAATYVAQPASYSSSFTMVDKEEPEPVRQWRTQRESEIAHRDKISAEKKEKVQAAAREYLDNFYEKYNKDKDKAIHDFRRDEADYNAFKGDTTSGGTSWDRIAKLIDLSGKGTKGGGPDSGKERFRKMLLDLKKDENAPGAKGI